MANNESTAINALLHNLYTRPIEEPAPADDLFASPRPAPAPAAIIQPRFQKSGRVDPATLPVAIAPVPSLAQGSMAAPPRAARGTGAPAMRSNFVAGSRDSGDEQTALWDSQPTSEPQTTPVDRLSADETRARAINFVKEPIAKSNKIVYGADAARPAATRPAAIARPAEAPKRRSTAMPVAPPPSASRAGYHIAKEILFSTTGLALVAVAALGIGVYLAVKTHDAPDAPKATTERDRAVAIMTGAPVPEVTHVTAPTVTPIVATSAAVEVVVPATEPAAKPAAEPVADADNETDAVEESVIEIEANTPVPAQKRTKRVNKAPRIASPIDAAKPAKAEKPAKPAKAEKFDSTDPVLAAIHETPKKVQKPAGPATEIAAAKGAAPTKGSGQVSIASNVKALIFVDGRPTGKSSPSSLIVPAGDHQITLLDPDTKKAKTATIQVAANKSISVRKEF